MGFITAMKEILALLPLGNGLHDGDEGDFGSSSVLKWAS
ncbi:hypothetical protein J2S19_002305 [Metabacillus malikii]|uniref:Uncharacterized protein n=1 Tax=Metabacillus malikii TaxID=1504265 RepID=A0ABT9ZFL6_9BACI|nr:hypothetical protein [Metabacillus malikii]